MKCSNCGFISSKDFYRCPYCGKIHESEDNVFKKSLTIGNVFVVRLQTLIYLIVGNLFGASILIDWYLGFKYGIVLWSFIILFGSILVISIMASKKNNISIIEKIDLFILLCLLLACGTCRIEGLFDVRVYMPTMAIPAFMILGSFISLILVFRKNQSKIRPLWTEVLLFTHLGVMALIFTFFLINKYCLLNGVSNPPFPFFQIASGGNSTLYSVQEILIYAAFGLSLLYVVNYNIILIAHIVRQVKGFYGKPRN